MVFIPVWTTVDLTSTKKLVQPGVVIHIYNLNIQEAEAGGALDLEGQPGLHNEFQNNQSYSMKFCLKTKYQKKPKQIYDSKTELGQ